MKKLFALFCLLSLFVVAVPADARFTNWTYKLGTLVNNLGLDASRSFSVAATAIQGAGLLTLYISVTDANDSVTALGMTCTSSPDGGTTDYTIQDCTVASGACTSSNASWTKDPSGISSPKLWPWRVDIEGLIGDGSNIECTFTNTGGVAADKLTVIGYASVKG
jgi:hypothetical protein